MTKFKLFKESWLDYLSPTHTTLSLPTDHFLDWFIGFTEGDGSFVVNHRGELTFILVQGVENKGILTRIQERIKLGKIIKQGERVYRLKIEKKKEIDLIILLFNGNLILPSRKLQFKKFFDQYITKKNPIVTQYLTSQNSPSLDNLWLLGYTEAEGCFTVSLFQNTVSFRIRFMLCQKGSDNLVILSKFVSLFNTGIIIGHSQKDNYCFIVSSLTQMEKIFPYFDGNLDHFIGNKKDSYKNFKEMYFLLIAKKHQDPQMRPTLIKLCKSINIPRKQK